MISPPMPSNDPPSHGLQRTSRAIVLADDDDDVREALVELLSDDPRLRVVAAGADADQAIALCREHLPDVVLVDVNMPAGGGERVARVLSEERNDLVIVALSANADRATRRRMLAAGADAFVAKGHAGELITVLATAARSSRWP